MHANLIAAEEDECCAAVFPSAGEGVGERARTGVGMNAGVGEDLGAGIGGDVGVGAGAGHGRDVSVFRGVGVGIGAGVVSAFLTGSYNTAPPLGTVWPVRVLMTT